MARVPTNGTMAGNTLETGWTTNCTDLAYLPGQTAVDTKASTKMIKKKGMGNFNGLAGKGLSAPGRMANNMETVPSTIMKTVPEEYGKMGSDFDG